MPKFTEVNLYVDGGSRGNPGKSGAGVYIESIDGTPLKKYGFYLGETTNNSAEYTALLHGLKLAKSFNVEKINIYSDSLLIVSHINGKYKISSSRLKPLYEESIKLLKLFPNGFTITHIPRIKNKVADDLANKAMDAENNIIKL
jgi:ribonuclease HI